MQIRHLNPAIQQIEGDLWFIFNFCTTLSVHIAWWCVTVNLRRYLELVYMCVILWCNEWMMNMRWESVNGKPSTGINLLFSKWSKASPGLTSPFDRWIAINSTYAFISYALWRDLLFNPGILLDSLHYAKSSFT